MSVKKKIEDKAFAGKLGALGNVNIIKKSTTGAPTSAAPVGTLCWNVYDGDAYICTVATGTWVKINV